MENRNAELPQTALQVSERLAQYLGECNVDAAMTLYHPSAIFAHRPGDVVTGSDAIREALQEFTALKPTLTLGPPKVLEADDVAFVSAKWTLTGTQPDGTGIELTGHGADVVCRQSDGSWKFLIDNPWGTDPG